MTKLMSPTSTLVLALVLAFAGPQMASAKDKQPTLKFSKQVQPLLAEAQKQEKAGDYDASLEALDKAAAIENRTDDDNYMIGAMRLNVGIAKQDNALIEKSLEAMLATGRVPEEDAVKFHQNLGAFAVQRNEYKKAITEFQYVLDAEPNNAELLVQVAELKRLTGDSATAVRDINHAIQISEANGKKADQSWYRRALGIANDQKLTAEIPTTSAALLKAYPNASNWRDVLIIFRDASNLDDQGNLDVMRLMRANGALTGERDYAEFAQTAFLNGLPGEANAVLDEGVSKGALDASKPVVKELKGSVAPKVASDRKSLPGLEKEAAGARNGRLAAGTADAYLGYGDYAKAVPLYKLALTKGGVDADTTNTRLGFALAQTGDYAGAEAALKAVGGAARKQLAEYYLIWVAQKAQPATAQPAAPAAAEPAADAS